MSSPDNARRLPNQQRGDEAARMLGGLARRAVPLGPITTYRVGGPASVFVEADSTEQLDAVSHAVAVTGIDTLVVGRGSNLLVADAGFDGLAVTLGPSFAAIEVAGNAVSAGGAVALPVLARRTAAAGLRGLEWAVGIPGSVGGGVRMNAGGHGADIGHSLARAEVFDLTKPGIGGRELLVDDLSLGYRRSSIGPFQIVTRAEFALKVGDRADAEEAISAIVSWRRAHQPGGANAGSVFANPPGDAAGRLLEAAGLKGYRRGSAFVSPRHANFFQADPGGSADDVHALMLQARETVLERFGVYLASEVRCIGFHP